MLLFCHADQLALPPGFQLEKGVCRQLEGLASPQLLRPLVHALLPASDAAASERLPPLPPPGPRTLPLHFDGAAASGGGGSVLIQAGGLGGGLGFGSIGAAASQPATGSGSASSGNNRSDTPVRPAFGGGAVFGGGGGTAAFGSRAAGPASSGAASDSATSGAAGSYAPGLVPRQSVASATFGGSPVAFDSPAGAPDVFGASPGRSPPAPPAGDAAPALPSDPVTALMQFLGQASIRALTSYSRVDSSAFSHLHDGLKFAVVANWRHAYCSALVAVPRCCGALRSRMRPCECAIAGAGPAQVVEVPSLQRRALTALAVHAGLVQRLWFSHLRVRPRPARPAAAPESSHQPAPSSDGLVCCRS